MGYPDPSEVLEFLEALDHAKTFSSLALFKPYAKQQEFFTLGATRRERLLTAGNQQGKTHAGAAEMTWHLTGDYPDWWRGRRFPGRVRAWAAGMSAAAVMDTVQRKLCGEPGVEDLWGTGLIPKDRLVGRSLGRGVQHGLDSIQVRHRTGEISILRFKSYEQGRGKFQVETLDVIWNDEEAPFDIYIEELARITATKGLIYTTFTSMMGETRLVARFFKEASDDRAVVSIGLADALHIPPEEYERIIQGIPAYQRVARIHGGIMRGMGRIFETPEEAIQEPPVPYIPIYWRKLWGIDPGIAHPFAAVLVLHDVDNDVIHVHHCIRMRDATPMGHCHAMRQIGAAAPVAWPKDAGDREKSTGEPLAAQYRRHGALMVGTHAAWPDGSMSTEAGIAEMDERMRTGRFKVAAQLGEWFEEYRNYHRGENLQIVKMNDDLLSATRICVMMLRHARAVQLGSKVADRRADMGGNDGLARGVDFDLF
jgi:phage terminase large subunit-like protein